jgi:hypothetical protein
MHQSGDIFIIVSNIHDIHVDLPQDASIGIIQGISSLDFRKFLQELTEIVSGLEHRLPASSHEACSHHGLASTTRRLVELNEELANTADSLLDVGRLSPEKVRISENLDESQISTAGSVGIAHDIVAALLEGRAYNSCP